jgi:hypothetical protein
MGFEKRHLYCERYIGTQYQQKTGGTMSHFPYDPSVAGQIFGYDIIKEKYDKCEFQSSKKFWVNPSENLIPVKMDWLFLTMEELIRIV